MIRFQVDKSQHKHQSKNYTILFNSFCLNYHFRMLQKQAQSILGWNSDATDCRVVHSLGHTPHDWVRTEPLSQHCNRRHCVAQYVGFWMETLVPNDLCSLQTQGISRKRGLVLASRPDSNVLNYIFHFWSEICFNPVLSEEIIIWQFELCGFTKWKASTMHKTEEWT